MGWVADKLRDESGLVRHLWDQMRDSIGQAVQEFNKTTSDAALEHLQVADCRSMSQLYRRVTKAYGVLAQEVFLDGQPDH